MRRQKNKRYPIGYSTSPNCMQILSHSFAVCTRTAKQSTGLFFACGVSCSSLYAPTKKQKVSDWILYFSKLYADTIAQLRCLHADSKTVHRTVFRLRRVLFESLCADKKTKGIRLDTFCFWRRRRDSNSRAGCPTYALSRGASSPT